MEELLDTREELSKTVSEMNHIVKDIIKVANMSNKDEESKILILSQLLKKTEDLIEAVVTPQRDLDTMLAQQRRMMLFDIEDRIYHLEQDIFSRIQNLLEHERGKNGL